MLRRKRAAAAGPWSVDLTVGPRRNPRSAVGKPRENRTDTVPKILVMVRAGSHPGRMERWQLASEDPHTALGGRLRTSSVSDGASLLYVENGFVSVLSLPIGPVWPSCWWSTSSD